MSNYSKNTNFGAKDNLNTGNPSKTILGAEFDTEFDEIAAALTTKIEAGDIPSGTTMLFIETSAPSGWTLDSTWDDKLLRIRSVGTNSGVAAGNWTISTTQINMSGNLGTHTHGAGNYSVTLSDNANGDAANNAATAIPQLYSLAGESSAGGSATITSTPANGTMVNGNWRPAVVDLIACSKN